MSLSVELLNDIKQECICPITGIYMATPVVTNTGFVCEMESIKKLEDPKTGKKMCPQTNMIIKSWQHCKKTKTIVSLLLKHNVIRKKDLFRSKYELEKVKKIFSNPKLANGKTIKQVLEKINLPLTNIYEYLKSYYLALNNKLKTFNQFKTFFEIVLNETNSSLEELYKFMNILLHDVGFTESRKIGIENRFAYEIVDLLLCNGVIYNKINPDYKCEIAVLTDFSYIEDENVESIMFEIFDNDSDKFNKKRFDNLTCKMFDRCDIESLTKVFVYSSFEIKQKMVFRMLYLTVNLENNFDIYKFIVNVLKYDEDMESNVFDENLINFCRENSGILGRFTNGYYDGISVEPPTISDIEDKTIYQNNMPVKRLNREHDENDEKLKYMKIK